MGARTTRRRDRKGKRSLLGTLRRQPTGTGNLMDFRFTDKVLLLRLYRLGRLTPALSAAEILQEEGFSVLALEYGNLKEMNRNVEAKIPRVRWESPWAALFPRSLRLCSHRVRDGYPAHEAFYRRGSVPASLSPRGYRNNVSPD